MDEQFATAILQQVGWKNTLLMQYATGFMRVAYSLALKGLPVASDDVPDEYQPPNNGLHKGIPGAAVKMLTKANLLRPNGMKKSRRKLAKGHWIFEYQLTSLSLAEKWLKTQGIEVQRQWKLELKA